MSNNPFNDLKPHLSALTEGMSGSALRTQQALVTFLSPAALNQYTFGCGLAEDVTETFKVHSPIANPNATTQKLAARWHVRSARAINEFHYVSDELRNTINESVERPLAQASAATSETVEQISETTKASVQVAASGSPAPKTR